MGGSLLIGYVGMNINMPLLFDEGCAALPLYVTGKFVYPYLREIMENKNCLLLVLLPYACTYGIWFLLPLFLNLMETSLPIILLHWV